MGLGSSKGGQPSVFGCQLSAISLAMEPEPPEKRCGPTREAGILRLRVDFCGAGVSTALNDKSWVGETLDPVDLGGLRDDAGVVAHFEEAAYGFATIVSVV